MEYFEKLCRSFAWIVPGMLIGGEKKKSEKARVRKGINVLISTPGRLIDHLEHTECLSLKNLSVLILDEADRMLELGYERDVQKIITCTNEQMGEGKTRQTLLLSATLTTGIEQLSEVAMRHPKFIDVAVAEDSAEADSLKSMATPENLKQTFIVVPAKLRLVCLAAFILWKCQFSKARKVLIFMSTQDMVDYHADLLDRCLNLGSQKKTSSKLGFLPPTSGANAIVKKVTEQDVAQLSDAEDGIPFMRLHGSMTQKDRMSVFNGFRKATSGVLLCTDVAARGLDLPAVDWIVQYNPPTSKSDYVHRVGRTARIGQKGSSLIFLLPSEANFVKELEGESLLLAEMTVEQILQKLHRHAEPSPRTGRPPSNMEEAATDLQMKMEVAVVSDEELHTRACQAYVSYVRSYASFPRDIRHIFCFKELHLGHIAKSYALRDPPKKITGLGKGHWVQNDERKKEQIQRKSDLKGEERVIKAQKKRISQKALVMSEYSSGFDGIDLNDVKKEKKRKPNFKGKIKKGQ
jgi:ATP-dependent RNA helicase DDX31/DBP7